MPFKIEMSLFKVLYLLSYGSFGTSRRELYVSTHETALSIDSESVFRKLQNKHGMDAQFEILSVTSVHPPSFNKA